MVKKIVSELYGRVHQPPTCKLNQLTVQHIFMLIYKTIIVTCNKHVYIWVEMLPRNPYLSLAVAGGLLWYFSTELRTSWPLRFCIMQSDSNFKLHIARSANNHFWRMFWFSDNRSLNFMTQTARRLRSIVRDWNG